MKAEVITFDNEFLAMCVKEFLSDYHRDCNLFETYFEIDPYTLDKWQEFCNDPNNESDMNELVEVIKKLVHYMYNNNSKNVFDDSIAIFEKGYFTIDDLHTVKGMMKYINVI